MIIRNFSGGSDSKESACNVEDLGLILRLETNTIDSIFVFFFLFFFFCFLFYFLTLQYCIGFAMYQHE